MSPSSSRSTIVSPSVGLPSLIDDQLRRWCQVRRHIGRAVAVSTRQKAHQGSKREVAAAVTVACAHDNMARAAKSVAHWQQRSAVCSCTTCGDAQTWNNA